MEKLAAIIEIVAGLLTASGIAYGLLALVGARAFVRDGRRQKISVFAPGVSILKPLKGADPRMYAGFVSHCVQTYAGKWEIVFGVSSLQDDAVAVVAKLRVEYPQIPIKLVECPLRIGSNGKVSTLAQMLPAATHDHIIVNDSDIFVSPQYLTRVMECFSDTRVGMVTAPYIGRTAVARPGDATAIGLVVGPRQTRHRRTVLYLIARSRHLSETAPTPYSTYPTRLAFSPTSSA